MPPGHHQPVTTLETIVTILSHPAYAYMRRKSISSVENQHWRMYVHSSGKLPTTSILGMQFWIRDRCVPGSCRPDESTCTSDACSNLRSADSRRPSLCLPPGMAVVTLGVTSPESQATIIGLLIELPVLIGLVYGAIGPCGRHCASTAKSRAPVFI